jgi:hypothetical protein
MVATSELLTESITHQLPEELDPPVPDLGRPEVIQVEPPERRRAKPSGDHSRAPATAPPPDRTPPPGRPLPGRCPGPSGHHTDPSPVTSPIHPP